MKSVILVMDLQFGSTGKGSLVGYLADKLRPDTAVAAWGPNAGHTFVDRFGRAFIHTMLPIAAIHESVSQVLLGPGSVINWDNLLKEVQHMNSVLDKPRNFRIVVHPTAMMVHPRHLEAEKARITIGSTMKGTGAALVEKITRDPNNHSPLVRDMAPLEKARLYARFDALGTPLDINESSYSMALSSSRVMIVEGAQGYSLGLHREFWPHCTSREVSPAQILSDCGMAIPDELIVYGTLRTLPIRVANRYDNKGNQVGSSGDFYIDQVEVQWEDLGLEPELTTVTKLRRRVFTFSKIQLIEALRLCRPDSLFLNFCNYLGNDEQQRSRMVNDMCRDIDEIAARVLPDMSTTVGLLGYGPSITDIRVRGEG